MKKTRVQALKLLDGPARRRLLLRLAAAGGAIALLALFLSLHVAAGPQALPAQQTILTEAAQGLDVISIEAELHPQQRMMDAKQTLRLQNRSGQALGDVVLRTWANAFSTEEYSPAAIEEVYDQCYPEGFSEGGIKVMSVQMGGQAVPSAYDDAAKTVQRITLPAAWQPGEWIELSLEYAIQIPVCNYRFGFASGIYTLGNAFPIPAVREKDAWRTDEYFPLGDPFYSGCANYSVTVTVPKDYQCAGSAYGQKTQAEDKWVYTFEAPAVRDFALSISDRFALAQATVGDTLVSSYALSSQAAESALQYAKQALSCFNELYGAYPYRHLTVAPVDFPFGGMEYPGLVLVQSAQYAKDQEQSLETVIVHEVAHQWWYAVVGSDQYYQPWQDEAMAEYSLLDYTSKYYGKDARDSLAFSRFETAMRVSIPQGVTPGSPIDYFGNMSEYSLVVYRRGAAMLVALDTSLGDKFLDFQRAYYKEQAFKLAGRNDFEQTLQEVTGQDYSALILDYLDTYIEN